MRKDETLKSALDDIAVIRNILNRTTESYKMLYPTFIKLGVIWAVYAALLTILNVYGINFMLKNQANCNYAVLEWLNLGVELLMCIALSFVYAKWSNIALSKDFSPLAVKLIYIWRLFIIMLIASKLLFLCIYPTVVYLLGAISNLELSAGAKYGHFYTLRLLPVIFPGVPLLVTANYIENKNMYALGTVIFILSAIWMMLLLLVTDGTNASISAYVFKSIIFFLTQIMPSISLIILGLELKRRNS